jgi:hypothetical protein
MSETSKLINDLNSVPNIIGNLGLSIAAAQKAFNLDYIHNIEQLLALAKSMATPDTSPAEFRALVKDMLVACAPSRYEFSETTLAVRLDLAQSMDKSVSVGLGVGYAGITLNAAYTIGYSYDYQAAAECRTVIRAIPADPVVFKPLLDRAAAVNDKALTVPARSEVDKAIHDRNAAVFEKLFDGKKAAEIKDAPAK